MARRQPFTFESNVDKIIPKIQETPWKVLNIIGANIVKEIRPTISKRSGKLKKSLGYWARKQEKDLQIGFKIFYSPFVYENEDPIKPVVIRNKDLIVDMIRIALNQISRR